MTETELKAALRRADKLIQWLSQGIGKLAPGDYADCYKDLNDHGICMQNLK